MYPRGAKGSWESCEEFITLVRGYSGAGEKKMGFLYFTS